MNKRPLLTLAALALNALPPGVHAQTQPAQNRSLPPLPHRVFAGSRFSMDAILARPYDGDVPFGATGERVWATSPQGWGFRDGVHLLYITNLNAFDLTVMGGGQRYVVSRAYYAPSHVHMVGGPGVLATASASFTYATDSPDNPLTPPFKPEKRWTCWSSGRREDWYAVDFGKPRALTGLDLYFYSDVEQGGGCAAPEKVSVALYRDGGWQDLPGKWPAPTAGGRYALAFGRVERAERVRLTFRNRGEKLYTGLYGFAPRYADLARPSHPRPSIDPQSSSHAAPRSTRSSLRLTGKPASSSSSAFRIEGDKWIAADDVLVSRLTVTNTTQTVQPFFVRMDSELSGAQDGFADQRAVQGHPLFLRAAGWDGKTRAARFLADLPPGEKRTFTFACAVADTEKEVDRRLTATLITTNVAAQIGAYQGWFDANVAAFACSDPRTTKMYYHRWYNVKKNSMNPRLGHLQHRTFAEGRWTSDWYVNAISYGAAHQIRESRWLRDPSYAWGHLQTWTDNIRPDGIYPSSATVAGNTSGQYTDWITSTAWDAHLTHPDRALLGRVVNALDRNAEGWRNVYGLDGSPLLVVDSHWWTGMEWQPSFFAFADYRTGGGAGTDPTKMTPLRRVDLTAYNFGNAQAVAKIYRELGQTQNAERMQRLADDTRAAVLAQMWDDKSHWFYSLRASDGVKAPTKEIIGLYPFYFDLPTPGKGYEDVWRVALDPAQFWTTWPLASTAKDCPAYAQNGWPIGPGGSICMWNGPSWPHANSIVLTAMANTLRHYGPSALTKEKLFALFNSFTRVQYRAQDARYPWTGEFYNGDTGEWKTTQRDYNHSTWVDPLISDLIGLVPRPDDTLEIDSLLPANAWAYYVLDGQAYRGHDVTVAYDKAGGHVAPNFKGYAVYLDGREIYHGDRPARVLYDMKAGKSLPSR